MKFVQLMTKAVQRKLPPLYATEDQSLSEKIIVVTYFMPDHYWYWYGIEYDGKDTLFGLVAGNYLEFGYFTLSELSAIRGPWGLPVERDRHWEPTPARKVAERHTERDGASIILGMR